MQTYLTSESNKSIPRTYIILVVNKNGIMSRDFSIDAVISNLEIIGEAARHIPDDIQKRYPEVPWSQMKGMRNMLSLELQELQKDQFAVISWQ